MKQKNVLLIIALIPAFLICSSGLETTAQEKITPKEILDKVDDLFRGRSSHGEMTMSIRTVHWSRALTLEFWSKGKDRSLIRIRAPKKEKGTTTLRVKNDIWNFLPKTKRIIKLPSSMMSASWMGSHFTNDDLVKESRMAEDYDYEISFEGERDGQEVTEITCIPKPEAAVVWGKVLVTVKSVDFMPLQIQYFDEDMKPARTMTFSQVKSMGDRRVPTLMTVVPENKPGEKTEVLYKDIKFDLDLPAGLFSLRSLQQ